MSIPGNYGKQILLSTLATAFIVWAMAAYNADYFFHSRIYESGDPGANSLSVLRASHFDQLYGPYSRWGFHHPGPAIFYYAALMESLWYSGSHLTPTPFNAQVLGTLILTFGFLAAGVGVAARWTRSRFFLPLLFVLAAAHFTAIDLHFLFISTWSACLVPLLFFGLMMATASVAAGEGQDLPLLVVAGSLTVHCHVAQPLFVLPLFAVGYLGLFWACGRAARRLRAVGLERPGGSLPWRCFPRAHRVAGILVFLFVLPMLVDLFKGAQSNFVLILTHLRSNHDADHSWLDSVYYFLRFGIYRVSITTTLPPHTNAHTLAQYFARHVEMTVVWLGALLSPLVAAAWHRFRRTATASGTPMDAPTPAGSVSPRALRWRFLGWLLAVWFVCLGLTLVWGHMQDGEMLFYNSWFNHSIYFVLLIVAAIAVSDLLETLTARSERPVMLGAVFSGVCLLIGGTICARHKDQFRCVEFADQYSQNQARTVFSALQAQRDRPRTKLLLLTGPDAWGAGTGIAALLERQGYQPRVLSEWRFTFGDDLALPPRPSSATAALIRERMDVWRVVPEATHPQLRAERPLVDGYALQVGAGANIDPAQGSAIHFAGPAINATDYVLFGFTTPDRPLEDTFVWTLGRFAAMNFRTVPIPADAAVEMTLDFFPFLHEGKLNAQGLGISWNNTELGRFQINGQNAGPIKVLIPAALWNREPEVMLQFDLPNATSPRMLGASPDPREFAFGARQVGFRTVAAPAP